MSSTGKKFAEAQTYAYFAAILVVLMLLFGLFVDSADGEKRRIVLTELSLVAHEAAHISEMHLLEGDFLSLQSSINKIAADHNLSNLAVSDARTGLVYNAAAGERLDRISSKTETLTLTLGTDEERLGSLLLEKDLLQIADAQSIGRHIALSLAALFTLIAAVWGGLRFFVITRSTQDDNKALPFSTLAAIASPFQTRDNPEFATLRPDQVASIVRQSGFTMAVMLSNGAFLVGSLWSHVPQWILVIWTVVVGSLAAVNLRVWLLNRNRPLPSAVSKQTLRRVTYQAGFLGLLWGIALSVFFVGADANGRFVLLAFGVGLAAGGTATLAAVPSAALAYTGAILVPAVLRFATLEGQGFGTLAFLTIIYAGFMGGFLAQVYHGFARNVLTRKAQERQAETIALVLNTYEEQASDWLWETDSGNRLQSPPVRMEHLFGCRTGELANLSLTELPLERNCEGWQQLRDAFSTQESFRDLVVRTVDLEGQDRWISLSGRKRGDGGWHGVGSDVTIRESALIQLRDAMEEAKSSSRATTAFLAATSHELRTPLNAIIGFSQFLESVEVPPDKAKDYLQTINGAGTHLLNIVNGILEMAQIEAGHKTLRFEDVDVAGVTQEAIEFLSLQSETAGTNLRFTPPNRAATMIADRQALRQVLLNVIGNALKFTPAGGAVDIEITVRDEDIDLVVSDTGIGIAEEDVARVLQPFAQVDDRLERRYDGTGLGLPIAKSLVEMHHGSFSVESRPGEGTRVRIGMPRSVEIPKQLAQFG